MTAEERKDLLDAFREAVTHYAKTATEEAGRLQNNGEDKEAVSLMTGCYEIQDLLNDLLLYDLLWPENEVEQKGGIGNGD
jgi:hypothetical protein